MEVVNEVMPTSPERIDEMMQPGPDGPIYMVNLLKFKEAAEYEDGRETDLSGYEAYQLYGQAVSRIIRDYGGEVQFAADVTFPVARPGRGLVGRDRYRQVPEPGVRCWPCRRRRSGETQQCIAQRGSPVS